MPRAAWFAAPCVSSDRCAEASYPVIVYWVSRKPSGSTYSQNPGPCVLPSTNPELLMVLVNTKDRLWCASGPKIRARTTTAEPATCHHTETLLMTANRCELKTLTSVTASMTTMNQK